MERLIELAAVLVLLACFLAIVLSIYKNTKKKK